MPPRFLSVGGHGHLVPPLAQKDFQQAAIDGLVIGDQDLHPATPVSSVSIAASTRRISCSTARKASPACCRFLWRPMISSFNAAWTAASAPKLLTAPFKVC